VTPCSNNAGGLFQSVGTTFTTPDGQTVTRQDTPFKPIAVVQKTTDNYLSVSTDAAARRVELKNQIASTTEQLKSASTDAEVQKLQGEIAGYSAALNNTRLRNQPGQCVCARAGHRQPE